jgi:hypothetical protein
VFDAWLTDLQTLSVGGLSRRELCDAAAAAGRVRSALEAFDARVGAAISRLDDGGPGASVMFRGASRCSQREADRRARRSEALVQMPSAASALAAGKITAEHVDTLAKAAEAISPEAVEASGLVRTATQRPADLLGADVRRWTRQHQTQESLEKAQKRKFGARRCFFKDTEEGMLAMYAEFDPIAGARVRARVEDRADQLFYADGGRNRDRDDRTPEQRRADALAELLTSSEPAVASEAKIPRRAPVRGQLLVIAQADGTAEITGVGPIPASVLAGLACTSELFGLVFSTDGQPLWHGTAVRLADDNQWRALIARDGGCVVCDAHPSKCEAHHVVFAGRPAYGPTNIDNMALVCRHDHHLIHDQGYVLERRPDGSWELRSPGQPRAGP